MEKGSAAGPQRRGPDGGAFRVAYDSGLVDEIRLSIVRDIPVCLNNNRCGQQGCGSLVWCDVCTRCDPHCTCKCYKRGCLLAKRCVPCGGCTEHCRCSPISIGTGVGVKLPYNLPYSAMTEKREEIWMTSSSKYTVFVCGGAVYYTHGEETNWAECISQIPVKHFLFRRTYDHSCYVDVADGTLLETVWESLVAGRIEVIDPYSGGLKERGIGERGLIIDGPTIAPVSQSTGLFLSVNLPGWSCGRVFRSPGRAKGSVTAQYAVIIPPERLGATLQGWRTVDSCGRELLERTSGRGRGLSYGTPGWLVHTTGPGREVIVSETDIRSRATHLILDDTIVCCNSGGTTAPLIVGYDRGATLAVGPLGSGGDIGSAGGCTIIRLEGMLLGEDELRFYQPGSMLTLANEVLRKYANTHKGEVMREEDVRAATRIGEMQLRECLSSGRCGAIPLTGTGCYISGETPTGETPLTIRMEGRRLEELLGSSLLIRKGQLLYANGQGASVSVANGVGHVTAGKMAAILAKQVCKGAVLNQGVEQEDVSGSRDLKVAPTIRVPIWRRPGILPRGEG